MFRVSGSIFRILPGFGFASYANPFLDAWDHQPTICSGYFGGGRDPAGLFDKGEIGGMGEGTGSGAVRSGAIAVVPEGGAARGATLPGTADSASPVDVPPGSAGASGGIGATGRVGGAVLGSGLTTGAG